MILERAANNAHTLSSSGLTSPVILRPDRRISIKCTARCHEVLADGKAEQLLVARLEAVVGRVVVHACV